MGSEHQQNQLAVMLLAAVIVAAVMVWAELPGWKREALIARLYGQPRTLVNPRIENAVRDFMRDVSRWEHAQRARKD